MKNGINSSLQTQVGGDHYRKLKIQPVQYIHANGIPFIEGCIIKYATRWRDKGGIKDLEKIIHFAELLIELEDKPQPEWTEDDERRMDIIGANGPDGAVYKRYIGE